MDIDKIKKELDTVEKNVANAIISEKKRLEEEKQELLERLKEIEEKSYKKGYTDGWGDGYAYRQREQIIQKYEEGENE